MENPPPTNPPPYVPQPQPATPPAPTAPAPTAPSPVTPPVPPPEQGSANYVVQHKSPKRWLKYLLIGLVSIIVILFAGTALAEFGLVNTGFDKLYGRTKLAGLWGGMPASSELAIATLIENPELFKIPENASYEFELEAESTMAEPLSNFKLNLKGSGLYLNMGAQEDLKIDLHLNSDLTNYQNIALQSRFVLNNKELYYQVPTNIALLEDFFPDILEGMLKDIPGKYVRYTLPEFILPNGVPSFDFDQLKVNILNQADVQSILKAFTNLTRRVGIERINGQVTSHWQFKANKDDFLTLFDNGSLTESEYATIPGEIDVQLDYWMRNGDYAVIKSIAVINFNNPPGEYEEVKITGELNLNPDLDPKTELDIPDEYQIIEEADLRTKASTTLTNLTEEQKRDQERILYLRDIEIALNSHYSFEKTVPIYPNVVNIREVKELQPSINLERINDPLEQYYYGYTSSDGQSYILTAIIEDPKTTDCTPIGSLCVYKVQKTF